MPSNDLGAVRQPKTQKGKRFLERRAPKLVENDKNTLIIKGGHTSDIVNNFLNDMSALKKPFVMKLKWHNPVLPFEDRSFIERMCTKYDCSLFIIGLHSKKRPHNIVFGRMYDGEVLDMFELGLQTYTPLLKSKSCSVTHGSKPMLIFSGEHMSEDKSFTNLKSLLIDMFRGPEVERIRSAGVEHQLHFIFTPDQSLHLRVRRIGFRHIKKHEALSETADEIDALSTVKNAVCTEALKSPWGPKVAVELEDINLSVDFEMRRKFLPSEDKWKLAHRIPHEIRKSHFKQKNRHMDVFGSRIGRVHVGRESTLDAMRPGSTLRTALTGHRKRGFERNKRFQDGTNRTAKRPRY